MDLGLKDKVALVTGASSGIGRATCLRLAEEGARVAALGRRVERLEQLVAEIDAAGGKAIGVPTDITVPQQCRAAVDRVIAELGGIDILVNAAGIINTGTIEDTRLEDWDYMMNINTRAPFVLMQLCAPQLIARQGAVVNVASVNGIRAFPGVLAYCVSKAACVQLTFASSLELAPKGVRVNVVCPGVTVTELHRMGYMDEEQYAAFLERSKTTHPLGRVGQSEEIADLIAFMASPKAGWVTGAAVPIDGGRSQTCLR